MWQAGWQEVVFEVERELAMPFPGTVKTPGGQAEQGTTVVTLARQIVRVMVAGLRVLRMIFSLIWVLIGQMLGRWFWRPPNPVLLYPLWDILEEGQKEKGVRQGFIQEFFVGVWLYWWLPGLPASLDVIESWLWENKEAMVVLTAWLRVFLAK